MVHVSVLMLCVVASVVISSMVLYGVLSYKTKTESNNLIIESIEVLVVDRLIKENKITDLFILDGDDITKLNIKDGLLMVSGNNYYIISKKAPKAKYWRYAYNKENVYVRNIKIGEMYFLSRKDAELRYNEMLLNKMKK